MRCEHHPGAEATAECEICEIPICGVCSNYTATAVLCDRCVNSVAMSDLFAAREKAAKAKKSSSMSRLLEEGETLQTNAVAGAGKKRKSRSMIWDSLHVVGIIGCFMFIGYQMYVNFSDANLLSPAEIAAQERQRAQLENCMLVFWEIAEILKSNKEPDASKSCLEAGGPNIIARVDDDIIVRHPRPDVYGYTDIFVSKKNPIPVLVE